MKNNIVEDDEPISPPAILTDDEQPNFLFVGAPRAGKTVALADFPGSHLSFNIDGKLSSIKLMKPKTKLIKIDSYEDFDYSNDRDIQYIRIGVKEFEKFDSNMRLLLAEDSSKKPENVSLDSLTLLADSTMKYAVSMKKQKRPTDIGVIDIPEFPEWKAEAMYLMSLFTDLKVLNSRVILTAHLTIVEKEVIVAAERGAPKFTGGTQKRIERILLTGGQKIAKKLPAYFHEIYFFNVEPSADYINNPPRRLALSVPTEDCDFAGTQLGVPKEMDLTLDDDKKGKTLWDYVGPAIEALRE